MSPVSVSSSATLVTAAAAHRYRATPPAGSIGLPRWSTGGGPRRPSSLPAPRPLSRGAARGDPRSWRRIRRTNSPSRSPRRAARPSGTSRRFGKELFLGNFRPDLIHPQPELEPAAVEKGEAFLERLRAFLTEQRRPAPDRARREDPRARSSRASRSSARSGMKIPEEYGGLGLEPGLLQPGAGAGRHLALLALDAAVRPPVDRPARAAAHVRLRGAEARVAAQGRPHHVSAFLLTEPDVGSDPARMTTTAVPTDDGTRLPDQRHEAVGDQRRDRRRGHRHGRRAEVRGPQGRHHRLHLPLRPRGHHGRAPQRVHGPARHRELADALRRRVRPRGEPHRRGGQGPAHRAVDAEHRPPVAAGDLRVGGQVRAEDLARVVGRAQAVGQPDRQARPGRPEARLRWPARRSASRRWSTCPAAWPTTSATTSASRPRSPSCTRPSWAGRPSTRWSRSAAAAATRPPSRCAPRGEKPVPAEQMLRDMRINRIFEGSTEIMHLLIAREAVDQHLQVAGDICSATPASPTRPRPREGRRLLRHVVPEAGRRRGPAARLLRRVRRPGRAPALRRARLAQARPLDLLPDGPLPGAARAEGAPARPDRRHRRRAVRDLVRVRLRGHRRRSSPTAAGGRELADLFCRQARRRADRLFPELWANDDAAQYKAAQKVLDGRYTWFEADVLDPAGDGPMMPTHAEPAAGQAEESPTVDGAPGGGHGRPVGDLPAAARRAGTRAARGPTSREPGPSGTGRAGGAAGAMTHGALDGSRGRRRTPA